MANKKTRITYGGINQDLAKSRVQGNNYYEANNIKLTPIDGQTFGTVSNAFGNILAITIPTPSILSSQKRIYYGDKYLEYNNPEIDKLTTSGAKQEIIGHVETTNGAIIFTTDESIDCIWEVPNLDDEVLDIELLYLNSLGFSKEHPIQAVFNYENELIQKAYWVDDFNYLRFINKMQKVSNGYDHNLIDVPASSINSKSTIDISRPFVTDSGGGGSHTAGMIQYAYTLYNLNGAETALSPASDLFPLDKGQGQGGGGVNEMVGALPIVHIKDVDKNYEYLKLYSVKYTEYNGAPDISLVYDGRVGNYTEFTFNDTGTKSLGKIGLAEFLFLGADPIKPSHIAAKNNMLFAANNQSTAYKIDIDMRAYSFDNAALRANIYNNIVYTGYGDIPFTGDKWDVALQGYDVPKEFDCVNLDFDTFRYQADGNTEGGTGKFITYELTQSTHSEVNMPTKQARFFKDNEIYRIGIVLYNKLGQQSEVKWVTDFKASQGNLEGRFNTLKVTLTQAFYDYIDTLPEEDRPTNYAVVRAIRNAGDRTIISQGVLTGMFVQDYTKDFNSVNTFEKRANKNPGLVKTPIPITRGYGTGMSEGNSYYPVFPTKHCRTMTTSRHEDPSRPDGDQDKSWYTVIDEIYRDDSESRKRQQSWQYTKMFQMYSPEATFHSEIAATDKDQLYILGTIKRDKFEWWDYSIDVHTHSPFLNYSHPVSNEGEPANFLRYVPSGFGIIGPGYRTFKDTASTRPEYEGIDVMKPVHFARRMHMYKKFKPLKRVANDLSYEILNKPEVTEVGQGIRAYNNDLALQYINNLSLVVSDSKEPYEGGADDVQGVLSVVSENNRCLTMVLGDIDIDHEDRPSLEDIYNATGESEWDVELFGEVRKTKSYIYSGALYNGYDYISKSRTEYMPIGEVFDISVSEAMIMSPGDTFVQIFRNTRLTKAPGTVYTTATQSMVETLEYLVETTVNLEERNDSSLRPWNTIVDPTAEEGTNYNNVYSTNRTLQIYSGDNSKIRNISRSETEIVASKVKIPGEFVDNWVDFRPNEVIYLDGKYGPITNLINHWDKLYAWQDFAVAQVNVQPRVQTQADDGVSIELGTGKVLHDYQYISTKSGSLNKWSTVSTNSGIYYFDANNKQLQRIQPNSGIEGVSEAKGLHSFLQKNIDRDVLRSNNPILGKGVVAGYDVVNGDIFTSILQEPEEGDAFQKTVSFNEKMNAYTSFYSFIPTRYIVKGERLFTVPQNNNEIWLHNQKNFQEFYGQKFASDITILINTDTPGIEKIFDGIEFDSEVTVNDIDVPSSTIDSIEAWTTYQKSGKIPLVVGKNIKRKFRTWRAFIPREEGKRNRLRDKWLFLKVGFNPDDNEKLILHDIIINYTV